jgi:hypothetical protein
MPFILLAIVAVASILVAGVSSVHNPPVVVSSSGPVSTHGGDGFTIVTWVIVLGVFALCSWWLMRRQKS